MRLFSDERSMLIEKVRKSGTVAFDEVSEIIRWVSDDVGSELKWPISIVS